MLPRVDMPDMLNSTRSHPSVHALTDERSAVPHQLKSKIVYHSEIAPVDRRPRMMTTEACDATQLVAHAMEHLADSRELPNGRVMELDQSHPDVYALMLLMEAKYQIYLSCPVIERRKNVLGALLWKGKERRRPRE